MKKPVVIDLFCGLGGWSKGFLTEGYDAIGFDIERHQYGHKQYPGQLILQDVRTLHGSQFANAAAIVASPPCQEFSYMAMPWTRAKKIAAALRGQGEFPEGYTGSRTVAELTELFDTCFRLQREASEAAGRQIPMVIENVKGAQPWVASARWHYGSYYLWGDVPALMPHTLLLKRPGRNFHAFENGLGSSPSFNGGEHERRHVKVSGDWFGPYAEMKTAGTISPTRTTGKETQARKAASAMIAEIPFDLASHIARVFRPLIPKTGSEVK